MHHEPCERQADRRDTGGKMLEETEKKYELTDISMTLRNGATLYRIRSLIDNRESGRCVMNGELGGYVQSERNLSQEGFCWVDGKAMAYENAYVSGNALVNGKSQVFGNARVGDYAWVSGAARVYGSACVFDDSRIGDLARAFGKALLKGCSQVLHNAQVFEDACICDDAKLLGEAKLYGNARLMNNARVWGSARVRGDAIVGSGAYLCGSVKIKHPNDCITIFPIGSRNSALTLTKCGKAFTGCFEGTWEELLRKSMEEFGREIPTEQYRKALEFAKAFFGRNPAQNFLY